MHKQTAAALDLLIEAYAASESSHRLHGDASVEHEAAKQDLEVALGQLVEAHQAHEGGQRSPGRAIL